MTRKRFKILEGALDYLRTTDEGANPDAPAGTPLKEYQDWKKGARNVSYDRTADSLPEALVDVAINPFYFDVTAQSLTRVPISKRVLDFTGINAARNAGNITTAVTPVIQELAGFFPAQCTVSIPDTTKDNANATSKLTGVKYKKKGFRSYTFPYGAKADAARESIVRGEIRAAIGNDNNYQLQFTSEKI